MDNVLLHLFQIEIEQQCEFVLIATNDLVQAFQSMGRSMSTGMRS